MDSMDWQAIYKDIEDRLLPLYQCGIWERGLYYFLLSQTRVRGLDSATVPLSQISNVLRCSDFQSRKTVRSLAEKGCIELEQTRQGHYVKVLLPGELPLPEETKVEVPVDLEQIDFHKNREYLGALLKREQGRCFYCLREINEDSCELDHVVSQLNSGDNGYRNIRQLFRKSLLGEKSSRAGYTLLRRREMVS